MDNLRGSLAARAGGEEVEHILDADTQRTKAGPTATLVRIERDAVKLLIFEFPKSV